MKIEVWSDYACPFCYIGKRRLEKAFDQFPNKENIEVEFKAFELDPNASKETSLFIHELISQKYGISLEEATKMNNNIVQQAAMDGLEFNFDSLKPSNTFDAHRLAKFAESKGKAAEITESLLQAYFTEGKNLSDHTTLVELAVQIGIDKEEAIQFLQLETFGTDVRRDEEEARDIGVQGVPFFVFNQKYAISGAQSVEVFLDTLNKVWEEESNKPSLQHLSPSTNDGVCTDDSCEISTNNK
ncbi:DsbA family oxidoreductase [Evansella sp. AB-rgal1]|uniref:DsbA family oxidoreductase n=1 Tax=Evansella sp. AB-rgal1 TaxID=3242696 RepID=UPI00359E5758